MIIKTFTAVATLALATHAHIQMVDPPPRNSQYNPNVKAPDYDIMAPVSPGAYPCKNAPKTAPVKTYQSGSSVKVQLQGTAVHGGGHCQFSISYNDKDFVAIKTIYETCPASGLSFDIPLPPETPACESCTFAWTWVNAIGNREYYMNCADITIKNDKSSGSLSGPRMTVLNLPGYPTVPEFAADASGDHGKKYYEQAETISISPSGSASPPPPTQQNGTKPATSSASPASTPPATTPSNAPAPVVSTPASTSAISQSTPVQASTTQTTLAPSGTPATVPSPVQPPSKPSMVSGDLPYSAIATMIPPGLRGGSPAPAPVPVQAPVPASQCAEGQTQCNGENYKVCSHNRWLDMPCPTGTKCSTLEGRAACIF